KYKTKREAEERLRQVQFFKHKNKALFLFLFLFSLSFVLGAVNFDEDYGTYGGYEFTSIFPIWLGGGGTSNYNLIENEASIINAYALLETYNEIPHNLIEDINFKGIDGSDVSNDIKSLRFELGTYQNVTKTNYSKPIYSEEEVCDEIQLNETNQTNTTNCYYPIIDYETYEEEELVWSEYNGDKVQGYAQLKIIAERNPNKKVDWIITFRGKELSEWAWWDGDWKFKREIKVKENSGSALSNYSTLFYIPYDSDMQADFDDLRFVDSAETTEIGYWIENKTDSNFAYVWVKVPNLTASINSTIYLYYGNSGASSNSNKSNTFLFVDEGNVFTSWTKVGTTSQQVTTQGNPQPAYEVYHGGSDYQAMTDWIYKDIGIIQQNVIINFEINRTHMTNFFFGVNSLGNGQMIRSFTNPESYKTNNWTSWTTTKISNTSITIPINQYNKFSILINSTHYRLYIDLPTTNVNSSPTIAKTLVGSSNLERTDGTYIGFNSDIIKRYNYLDNILIRTYTSSEPTYTIGAEQQSAGTISVNYVTPPTPENNSNLSVNYIPVEVDVNYTNATLDNITYNFYKDGVLNASYFYNNETLFVNHTGCTCANWEFNVTACYKETIGDTYNCVSTETRQVTIDILPPEINITSPLIHYNYLIDNQTLDLNFTVIDASDHLDSCWYSYPAENTLMDTSIGPISDNISIEVNNGVYVTVLPGGFIPITEVFDLGYCNNLIIVADNTYVLDCDGIQTDTNVFNGDFGATIQIYNYSIFNINCSENTTFQYITGKNNLTLYANDTFGNEDNSTVTFYPDVAIYGFTFDDVAYSTKYNTFNSSMLVNTTNVNDVGLKLVYNGTNYYYTRTANGSLYTFEVNALDSTQENVNITFFNNLTIYKTGNTTTYQLDNETQELDTIFFGQCNATYDVNALNLTVYTEGTTDLLTASIEMSGTYYIDGDGTEYQTMTFEDTNENQSNFYYCIYPGEENMSFTGITYYSRTDSDSRDYLFNNFSLSNESQNIDLFLLETNVSDIVTITVIDNYKNYVQDAIIYVQRWIVSTNTFETVAIITTNEQGQAFANLQLYNVYYRFVVYQDGEIVKTTSAQKLSSTSLQIEISVSRNSDYLPFEDIAKTLTFNNETNVVSFSFVDSSGALASGCLKVYNSTAYGLRLLSSECSTSVSSTLSYLATDNSTTYVAKGILTLDDNYNSVKSTDILTFKIGDNPYNSTYEGTGYVVTILLIGTLLVAGIAMGSVVISLVGAGIGLFFVNYIGWVNIPPAVLYPLLTLFLVVIVLDGVRKR
ncbi:MAG: DUF2341 domain-containing protein, partial [Spirochaetia bacterium]|nr:DUF2341 domain-containing protein [Spirochaetia bacterium]